MIRLKILLGGAFTIVLSCLLDILGHEGIGFCVIVFCSIWLAYETVKEQDK